MKTKILLIFAFILLVSISIFAELKGRDIVEKGKIREVNGYLTSDGNEWYLKTSDDKMLIHFGPEFYREEIGLNLKENMDIDIKGFIYKNEISPILIKFNGNKYTFRDENGKPKWAGKGHGTRQGNKNKRNYNNDCNNCDD